MCCPKGEDSMSSGLGIKATSNIENACPIPKARCTNINDAIMPAGYTSGIIPLGSTDAFPRDQTG